MAKHRDSIGRGGGDHKVVLCQAGGGAIIHGDPIFAQHQSVTCLADGQFGESVAINFVEKCRSICALNVDFSESCDITDTNGLARGPYLSIHGLPPMGFAGFGEPLRAQPQAHLNKDRALLLGPGMAWGLTGGAEICPAIAAREGTNRGWGIGRTEDGCADLWNGFARQLCHNRKPAHIGGLALICGHAQRGVAFEVFNADEIFLMGQFDVFYRHVVLLIEPSAVATFYRPKRCHGDRGIFSLGQLDGRR